MSAGVSIRSFQLYVCTSAAAPSAADIQAAMDAERYTPCVVGQAASGGWVDAYPDHLAVEAAGWIWGRYRLQERRVPPAALREAIEDRCAEWEQRMGEPPRGGQRAELRDEVAATLRARAPTQSSYAWLGYHPGRRWLVVTGGKAIADAMTDALRAGFAAPLKMRPGQWGPAPGRTWSDWIRGGDVPDGFELGDRVRLSGETGTEEERRKLSIEGEPIDSDAVLAALDQGLYVREIELVWDFGGVEPMRFVVGETGRFTRISYPPAQIQDEDGEDEAARLVADLYLAGNNIEVVVRRLSKATGGLPEVEAA